MMEKKTPREELRKRVKAENLDFCLSIVCIPDLCGYGDYEPNLSLNDLAQKMVYRVRF